MLEVKNTGIDALNASARSLGHDSFWSMWENIALLACSRACNEMDENGLDHSLLFLSARSSMVPQQNQNGEYVLDVVVDLKAPELTRSWDILQIGVVLGSKFEPRQLQVFCDALADSLRKSHPDLSRLQLAQAT